METSNFLDPFNKIAYVFLDIKVKRVLRHKIFEFLSIPLKDSLIPYFHMLNQLPYTFDIRKTSLDPHRPINRQIAHPVRSPPLIKLITYLTIDPKTEIIDPSPKHPLFWNYDILTVLHLLETTITLGIFIGETCDLY